MGLAGVFPFHSRPDNPSRAGGGLIRTLRPEQTGPDAAHLAMGEIDRQVPLRQEQHSDAPPVRPPAGHVFSLAAIEGEDP